MRFFLSLIAIFSWLALAGCKKQEPSVGLPKNSKAAASQIQQAFSSSAPEAKQQSDNLAESLRNQDYEKAFDAMMRLRGQQAQNIQQVIAVENADRRLQADVLAGVERGDPRAIRAWDLLKRTRKN